MTHNVLLVAVLVPVLSVLVLVILLVLAMVWRLWAKRCASIPIPWNSNSNPNSLFLCLQWQLSLFFKLLKNSIVVVCTKPTHLSYLEGCLLVPYFYISAVGHTAWFCCWLSFLIIDIMYVCCSKAKIKISQMAKVMAKIYLVPVGSYLCG